jgi:hypothetical protein
MRNSRIQSTERAPYIGFSKATAPPPPPPPPPSAPFCLCTINKAPPITAAIITKATITRVVGPFPPPVLPFEAPDNTVLLLVGTVVVTVEELVLASGVVVVVVVVVQFVPRIVLLLAVVLVPVAVVLLLLLVLVVVVHSPSANEATLSSHPRQSRSKLAVASAKMYLRGE